MKYARWLLIALYIYFILTRTIIARPINAEPIFRGMFWEVQNEMWSDIRLNILLFLPLGFLVSGWKGVIVGFALSCVIEVVQYIGHLGYCELDDILNNTIGAGIGAAVHLAIYNAYKRRNKE